MTTLSKIGGQCTLEDFKWLTGKWRGEIEGSYVEEHWTYEKGKAMIGMFRWIDEDGEVKVYEWVGLKKFRGDIILYVRHFDGDFNMYEHNKIPIQFKLIELEGQRALFTPLHRSELGNKEYRREEDMLTFIDYNSDGSIAFEHRFEKF